MIGQSQRKGLREGRMKSAGYILDKIDGIADRLRAIRKAYGDDLPEVKQIETYYLIGKMVAYVDCLAEVDREAFEALEE